MKTLPQHTCLVPVGDRFALIDRQRNTIHLLNAAAAQLWQRPDLVVTGEHAAAAGDCLAWFHTNGLLPAAATVRSMSSAPHLLEAPVIFGSTPLEVAANNSAATADPFFEWIP